MDKKKIETIISLIKNLEAFDAQEKETLVGKLKYMPEWQIEELKVSLIKLHQEEEKFKSDVSRLELKYDMEIKNMIERKQD